MKEKIWENIQEFIENSTEHGSYWFPLAVLTIDVPVAAYDIRRLYNGQIRLLETVLRKCGIETVTKVDFEMGPEGVFEGENILNLLYKQREYEVHDLRFWRPRRRKAYCTFPYSMESYYFDAGKAWLMYVSHAGTLTFAGANLVAAAQETIPDEYLF